MSFRVPEHRRVRTGAMASEPSAGNNGAFSLPPRAGFGHRQLRCIASDGRGWEHVSVHATSPTKGNATPNWDEMCYVKDVFWEPEDVVMQLHPRRSQYVNTHAHVLHLWRPTDEATPIPQPDYWLVGVKDNQTLEEVAADLREAGDEEAAAAVLNYGLPDDLVAVQDKLAEAAHGGRKRKS